jgi:hypothetical protein
LVDTAELGLLPLVRDGDQAFSRRDSFLGEKREQGIDVMVTIFCDFRQFSAKKLSFFSDLRIGSRLPWWSGEVDIASTSGTEDPGLNHAGEKLRTKIYTKSFRPKLSFIKSITDFLQKSLFSSTIKITLQIKWRK